MSISALNPWQVLDQLQQDAWRRHADHSTANKATNNTCSTTRRWHPAVDISETDDSYHILMDLPGIKAENVSIKVENNQLQIAGKRTRASEGGAKTHHSERATGSFSRHFKLPKDADATQVNASFETGVLAIEIYKQEESKPRKVTINVKN
ncbi:hypothetical protein A9Q99_03805 [Gammaproteobacteria bacterium 45_16_T64]|nr:hypothetical protein A9Q99_03805 [Gammaproteobacteria bacterium 45_16_T64]